MLLQEGQLLLLLLHGLCLHGLLLLLLLRRGSELALLLLRGHLTPKSP
jgi:hypothetical protein